MKYLFPIFIASVFLNCSTTANLSKSISEESTEMAETNMTPEAIIDQQSDNKKSKSGLSPERLEWITEMCREAIEENQVPGIVALVSRNGEIAYHEAFGAADASGRILNKNDIFRIASQTKAITSTAVLMLWERGHFRLDDPISKYIPEFKNPTVLDSFIETDSSFTAAHLRDRIWCN